MIIYKEKNIPLQLLLLITHAEDEHRLERVLQQLQLPIYYQCFGKGSATSEILDLCGLSNPKRLITLCMIPHPAAHTVLLKTSQVMSFHKKGKGVGALIPLTGMQDGLRHLFNEHFNHQQIHQGETTMKDKAAFSMILAAANYGYSNDVIHAAKEAGAQGGTILKGRRHNSDETMHFLKITLQQEQELILIIVPHAKKASVMTSISQKCGLKTPAHTIVLSLPIEDAIGLEELSD